MFFSLAGRKERDVEQGEEAEKESRGGGATEGATEGAALPSARRKPAPKTRLSAGKRAVFLEVLGQTGNRSLAAEAIGVEPRLMDQRRAFDPLLDRDWRE